MAIYNRINNFLGKIAGMSDAKTLKPFTERERCLKEIADKVSDIESDMDKIEGLPTVAAKDEGKILKVVEGKWALTYDAVK